MSLIGGAAGRPRRHRRRARADRRCSTGRRDVTPADHRAGLRHRRRRRHRLRLLSGPPGVAARSDRFAPLRIGVLASPWSRWRGSADPREFAPASAFAPGSKRGHRGARPAALSADRHGRLSLAGADAMGGRLRQRRDAARRHGPGRPASKPAGEGVRRRLRDLLRRRVHRHGRPAADAGRHATCCTASTSIARTDALRLRLWHQPQILEVEAEVGCRRHRLHLRAFDRTVRLRART